jgi:hypothetical protein
MVFGTELLLQPSTLKIDHGNSTQNCVRACVCVVQSIYDKQRPSIKQIAIELFSMEMVALGALTNILKISKKFL